MYESPFGVNEFAHALERRRAHLNQHAENATRLAWSYAQVETTGVGEIMVPTVVPFDCTFVERPRISYGWSLDGETLVRGSYPTVSGGVWKWQQDRRGYYIGAWTVFNITGDPSYVIEHDFTFAGLAMKDLPDYLMERF